LLNFSTKDIGSKDTVVFIGCYACDYSRKAYPDILKLVENKKTNFIFAHYPAKGYTTELGEVAYCVNKYEPDKFWDFNNYLFAGEEDYIFNPENLNSILEDFNLDVNKITECANSEETKNEVNKEVLELEKTNIYGTPTIFINGKAFVGPKPYRVYRSAINKFIFF